VAPTDYWYHIVDHLAAPGDPTIPVSKTPNIVKLLTTPQAFAVYAVLIVAVFFRSLWKMLTSHPILLIVIAVIVLASIGLVSFNGRVVGK
jgi:hypothetical protein